MSNKLKRKAKKKTVDFGEYTISLPSGTMLESFIKYTAEEPWNIDRVTDFQDAHSARVRKKVEKNQSFSQQEMDEMYEFSEYFLDQYTDEEGCLDQEIADCYDEMPFILRVISSYFDYQEEIAKTEALSSLSDVELKEAGMLRDKILSAGDSLLISGLVSGEIVSMVLLDFIMQDPEKAAEYREDLLFDCAIMIYEGGFLVVDVIDDEKTKIFGVAGLEPGKWRSMSKEELEQVVCSDEDGNPVPLDDGEEFVDFVDMVKE
ncbi:hypothetical protein [Blautia wexlerae]|uniref:hypothetical protein n=1 Tax=Blautia wexlerae TaxID=418240 RepID=UPI00189FE516|nr:hypothetical protein [Blautia wexlerae]